MEVRAIYKYARCSAFKAREITRAIQGMPVEQALDYLTFTPRKAARLVEKTLKSAMANAENNEDMDRSELVIKEAVVGEGPTIKRFRARARGSAARIRKRTSHIRVIVTDELDAWKLKDRADMDDNTARRSRKKSKARAQQPATAGGGEAADVDADDELERMNAEAEAELEAEEQAEVAAETDAETSEPTDTAESEEKPKE
jgi:large subunit ribosomal protein L22